MAAMEAAKPAELVLNRLVRCCGGAGCGEGGDGGLLEGGGDVVRWELLAVPPGDVLAEGDEERFCIFHVVRLCSTYLLADLDGLGGVLLLVVLGPVDL